MTAMEVTLELDGGDALGPLLSEVAALDRRAHVQADSSDGVLLVSITFSKPIAPSALAELRQARELVVQ